MQKKTCIGLALLAVGIGILPVLAKTPAEVLQEAIFAEEIEGDLVKAIRLYEGLESDQSVPRYYLAQALYRKANCQLKAQDQAAAIITLERLINDFADQPSIVEKVKPILQDLALVDLACFMPPETLLYIELGSPGRQIETILNMLKGTPLENPLAMVASDYASDHNVGPQDILTNLLNPSMMAEFKKIRGLAIGVTAIKQPGYLPFILVLYPGKSDALRGLLVAFLGIAGRKIEPVAGMEAVSIAGARLFACHDENVILLSSGLQQLEWSAKAYKGQIHGPSLANSSKTFARLGKQVRQDNTLTVWLNLDRAVKDFRSMPAFAHMGLPGQPLDVNDLDELTAQLAIKGSRVELTLGLSLKEGHYCLAYDLIRTPPLDNTALTSVPSDAILIFSLALPDPNSGQAKAASERIGRVIGLDIVRALYGNIRQVTAFVLPHAQLSGQPGPLPAVAYRVGLSVAGRDEQVMQQVAGLLSLIMGAAGQDGGGAQAGLESGGRFCMDYIGANAIFALDQGVIEAARQAVQTGRSAARQGPFAKGLAEAGPSNKLLLANIGGLVELIIGRYHVRQADPNQGLQVLRQLSQACKDTTLQIRTVEQDKELALSISLDNIPPLNQLWPAISQLARLAHARTLDASGPYTPVLTAQVIKARSRPVIDGKVDPAWSEACAYTLEKSYYLNPSGPADCSASFRTLWDGQALYVLVEVSDDDLRNDSTEFWQDDSIEIFLDPDNSKSSTYRPNDLQLYFVWGPRSGQMGQAQQKKIRQVEYALIKTDKGYNLEVSLPWAAVGVKPIAGTTIGLDIQVSDDDGGGNRDHKIAWNAGQDDAWQRPAVFGNACLAGLVAWWRLDEKASDKAYDSSGNGYTATLFGDPTWLPSGGKIGGALEFDGLDDWVETGYSTYLPCWTIAVWVKSPTAPSEADPSGPVHREKNFQINWNHVLNWMRGAVGICVGDQWYRASFGQLQSDTWYHLVATYDGQILKAYKDGKLVTTTELDHAGKAEHEPSTLKLGRHATKPYFFKGTIDDVRIYSYALSDAQVQDIYNIGQ